jgi:hypothetical protein
MKTNYSMTDAQKDFGHFGTVEKVHKLGEYVVVEYTDKEGNLCFGPVKTNYTWHTLEEAIVHAIAHKYDGPVTQANEYFIRAIRMPEKLAEMNRKASEELRQKKFAVEWKLAMDWMNNDPELRTSIRNVASRRLSASMAGSGEGIGSSDINHEVYRLHGDFVQWASGKRGTLFEITRRFLAEVSAELEV